MSKTYAFARGEAGINEAIARQKSGGSDRIDYFKLADEESCRVRFLNDLDSHENEKGERVGGVITVEMHGMVPTKPQPKGYKGDNWPKRMGAVCRAQDPIGESCYICDVIGPQDEKAAKTSARVFAIAVLREEVRGEDGKIRGYRTKMHKVKRKKEGKEVEVEEPHLILITQGVKNFWGQMRGHFRNHGTILDRDYFILRDGEGLQTEYRISPMDPISDKDGNVRTAQDPAWVASFGAGDYCPAEDVRYDLNEIVGHQASLDYYYRFFDPSVNPWDTDDDEDGEDSGKSDKPDKPDTAAVDDDELDSLAARIQGHEGEPVEAGASSGGGLADFDA